MLVQMEQQVQAAALVAFHAPQISAQQQALARSTRLALGAQPIIKHKQDVPNGVVELVVASNTHLLAGQVKSAAGRVMAAVVALAVAV